MKIPFEDIQDQCFITATRLRSKDSSQRVPDIFPLQEVHRKLEHAHQPREKEL